MGGDEVADMTPAMWPEWTDGRFKQDAKETRLTDGLPRLFWGHDHRTKGVAHTQPSENNNSGSTSRAFQVPPQIFL